MGEAEAAISVIKGLMKKPACFATFLTVQPQLLS